MHKLKEVFDVFDYDGSGNISVDELVNTIRALGIENQAQQILAIVNNSGHSGDIDFAAFLAIFGFNADSASESSLWLTSRNSTRKEKEFSVRADEFERAATSVGEHFSAAEVEQIIEYADKDRDGGINY